MQKIAFAEFQRWRDACAEQRQRIARAQFLAFQISELIPDLDTDDLESVAAPNGKLLGECTPVELGEMIDWCAAILTAGREVVVALKLRSAANARI
jgi:hypothetical protein